MSFGQSGIFKSFKIKKIIIHFFISVSVCARPVAIALSNTPIMYNYHHFGTYEGNNLKKINLKL